MCAPQSVMCAPQSVIASYGPARTNTPLGIVHVETIFQCCFLIQYHINHKNVSIMYAY